MASSSSPSWETSFPKELLSAVMWRRESLRRGPRRAWSVTPSASARFRPCIDIHKGKVKQIVGSTLKDLPPSSGPHESSRGAAPGAEPGAGGAAPSSPEPVVNFVSEKPSSWYAELYARDNLPGGHVIMLGADGASRDAALEALRAYPGGLQLGGGVTAENAKEYLEAGASHVIVTSYVFREGRVDLDRLRALVAVVGKKRLVLDLSCRKKDGKYVVVTDRWQRFSDLVVDGGTLEELSEHADEFLVHGVDVEGMRLGIDAELVALLGQHSPIPVTYAGGARTLEDLEIVGKAGMGRVDVTVGSALDIFGGNLPYEDVVAWHREQLVLV